MTDQTAPDDRTIVTSLLAVHGLSPSTEEVDRLVAAYPAARGMAALLHTMPGVRYEEPAVTFDPRV